MMSVTVIFKSGVVVRYNFDNWREAQAFMDQIHSDPDPFEYDSQYIDPREVADASLGGMDVDRPYADR
jgi:hypothetical protein